VPNYQVCQIIGSGIKGILPLLFSYSWLTLCSKVGHLKDKYVLTKGEEKIKVV